MRKRTLLTAPQNNDNPHFCDRDMLECFDKYYYVKLLDVEELREVSEVTSLIPGMENPINSLVTLSRKTRCETH